MNSKNATIFFILIFAQFRAQINLVPNPSFELSVVCPTIPTMLTASNWTSFSASPDYFNSCSQPSACGTPSNVFGNQIPATGNAYCGFLNLWPGIGAREYLGAKLTQTLTIGQRYYTSMKVSLAERWLNTGYPMFIPSNKCGMKFTGNKFSVQDPLIANNQAVMYSAAIISDTTGWTTLRGTFVADSAYQYVVLGNFFYNSRTDTISRPLGFDSYFFVDDVVVSTDSAVLFNGIAVVDRNDKLIIYQLENTLHIISSGGETKEAFIIDLSGTVICRREFESDLALSTVDFISGVYFVLVYEKGELTDKKLISISSQF
jgi:hypothetical protein